MCMLHPCPWLSRAVEKLAWRCSTDTCTASLLNILDEEHCILSDGISIQLLMAVEVSCHRSLHGNLSRQTGIGQQAHLFFLMAELTSTTCQHLLSPAAKRLALHTEAKASLSWSCGNLIKISRQMSIDIRTVVSGGAGRRLAWPS